MPFRPKKNSRAKEAQELILGRFLAFYGAGLHIHMQLQAIHIQQQPEVTLFMMLDLWHTILATLEHSREGSQLNIIYQLINGKQRQLQPKCVRSRRRAEIIATKRLKLKHHPR